jgi:thiamine pyrophosphate-dependent acetolactate synthase large subunit-like protein
MQLTVGQIIGKALKAYGVPYVAGLPGHGKADYKAGYAADLVGRFPTG